MWAYGAVFGDILMKCVYRMRPYEVKKGSVNRLHRKWENRCIQFVSDKKVTHKKFKWMCRRMIEEFDRIPITDEVKPRVGIVGEILVKFLPAANNYLAELLNRKAPRPWFPDLIDFLAYCFLQPEFQGKISGSEKIRGCDRPIWASRLWIG